MKHNTKRGGKSSSDNKDVIESISNEAEEEDRYMSMHQMYELP